MADGDGFPVCRRWMNVTHRINPTSISVTEFRLRIDQIRTRQYDISQEPSQPASQPYTAHVGSSPDFMHHHQPFFGPLWVKIKYLDIHILNLTTHQTPHSHSSLPHTVSSKHQSSYGVGPSHMFGITTMTPPSASYT
ncbi:hypothetical protein DEO72_LG9g649 [Vigna unguiculata]|uniref:Uncharacterized protein n=1 Tax=Vigna unguiculata TaxID=3917 RepID=A0A4D6MY74_VIGUN|nr:hypothetical protein DEO72_LG9g649 [Vigna unguiculata]